MIAKLHQLELSPHISTLLLWQCDTVTFLEYKVEVTPQKYLKSNHFLKV